MSLIFFYRACVTFVRSLIGSHIGDAGSVPCKFFDFLFDELMVLKLLSSVEFVARQWLLPLSRFVAWSKLHCHIRLNLIHSLYFMNTYSYSFVTKRDSIIVESYLICWYLIKMAIWNGVFVGSCLNATILVPRRLLIRDIKVFRDIVEKACI